jgi:hypothetical protein
MTNAGRGETRRIRREERQRKRIEKRIRKPWLLFRKVIKRPAYEETAIAATGLDDFGDEYYGSGFDRLLESLREANLTFLGRMMTQRAIVLALKQRLLIEDLRKREPQFFEAPLIPPIIVTGLPRTGTTLLHRLLAEDPASRAPELAELIAPVQPKSRFAGSFGRARLGIELFTLRAMTSNLDAMHVSRPSTPEECMFAMSLTFRSSLFWTLAPCYSYLEWYSEASRDRKYREYRDVLALLQSHAPDRRLVLKAPEHLGSVGELLTAVPEALVVVCHRRPAEAVTSFNSLIHVLHQAVSSSPDPLQIGAAHLHHFESETRRYVQARESFGHRILEIDYAGLTADPMIALARVYERSALALSPGLESRFRSYIAANPKDRLGRHLYSPSDYGQSEAMIDERLAHYRMKGADSLTSAGTAVPRRKQKRRGK